LPGQFSLVSACCSYSGRSTHIDAGSFPDLFCRFWPIIVVFDSNQADLEKEDRVSFALLVSLYARFSCIDTDYVFIADLQYSRINPDDDPESDVEAYLERSGRRDSAYGGGRGSSRRRSLSRSSRRRRDYDYDDDEFSSEEEELDAPPPRRNRSRRGSLSAGMNDMSLARSSSRASNSRRSRRGSIY
jgi:hypothetical protein